MKIKVKTFVMGAVGVNGYVVSGEDGKACIIDCDAPSQKMLDYIDEKELEITHLLLTHGHGDHIGAVEEIKQKYGCEVVACKKEESILLDPKLNFSMMMGASMTVTADRFVSDGDTIAVGEMEFKVIETPGHTVGSVCYIVQDNMFSGDTLFEGSCGRTDLPTGDTATIMKSLKRLKALEENYVVYPGHGPYTSLEIERQSNPYMS
ncbi:MAG: MBL fold metallo-hydrolase [Bacillota bacterium]